MKEIATIRQMLVDELESLRRQALKVQAAIVALEPADQDTAPAPKKSETPKTAKPATKKPAPKKSETPKTAKPAKPATKTTAGTPLPVTTGEWFLTLFTKTPQSIPELLDAAARKVGGQLSKTARDKLKNRLSFHLSDLKKKGKIGAVGGDNGRNKLYVIAGD